MGILLRLAAGIDRLNEAIGRLAAWLGLAMILLAAYNAVVRYFGKRLGATLSSNQWIELQWYLFSLVFLLGAAYTLRHNAHVRVDALYSRLSARGRAWINLVGTILFLVPTCVGGFLLSWPSVRNSWAVRELSPDPGGLPRYPIKTVLLVALALLLLQGIAELIRQAAFLRGRLGAEAAEAPEARGEGV